tara:strand:- start:530 stop:1108 length:579 start_codon:yes stop_codon:yes gene_type:complete
MKMTKKKKRGIGISLLIIVLIFITNFFIDYTVDVKQELIINANIDSTWQVMGTEFDEVDAWCSNFIESEASGNKKFNDIDYSSRVTVTTKGENTQALDEFDPVNHTLKYHITKGKPGIAKEASAVWSLANIGSKKTKVILEFKFLAKGWIGLFLSGKVRSEINGASLEIAEELKYYMENGTVHPRKIKSLKK